MSSVTENGNRGRPEYYKGPVDTTVKKEAGQQWQITDQPGEFKWISKELLDVDPEYQRKRLVQARIGRIAARFSWASFGVLSVARRPNGRFLVFDGQHRKLGADKREDVSRVPCMVFDMDEVRKEAIAFLETNNDRGSVKSIDKFRSMLIAGDQAAIGVKAMLAATGHHVGEDAPSQDVPGAGVRCVSSLLDGYRNDAPATQRAWLVAAGLAAPGTPGGTLMQAMIVLERHLNHKNAGSLTDTHNVKKLHQIGLSGLMDAMYKAKQHYGSGGGKVAAAGIVAQLNRNRKTRRLPGLDM